MKRGDSRSGRSESMTGDEESDSYTGDMAASEYAIESVSLPRTCFKKRNAFGRYKDVFLTLEGTVLSEYPALSSRKPASIRQFGGGCQVLDGSSLVNDSHCMLLVPEPKPGTKKGAQKIFYKAANDATFETWFRAVRRAVGHMAVKNGKVRTGLDVSLFEDPTVISNIDGTIVQANDAVCKLLGWSIEQLVGKPVKVIVPPSIAHAHDEYMKRFETTGNKRLIGKPRVMKALHHDGSLVKVLLSLGEVGSKEDKMYVGTLRPVENNIAFGSQSQSADGQDEDAGPIFEIVDKAAEMMKQELAKVNTKVKGQVDDSRAKISHLKNKNEKLKETIEEIDTDMNRLRIASLLSRRALEGLMSAGEEEVVGIDNVATASQSDNDVALVALLKKTINAEIELAMDSTVTTLFRADDINTRKLNAFLLVVGGEYLHETLAEAIQHVRGNLDRIAIDEILKVSDNSAKAARAAVREASTIASAISKSVGACPAIIRNMLCYLHDTLAENFPGSNVDPKQIVSGCLFLRFFVPAIVAPNKYGLLLEDDEKDGKRAASRARTWALLGRIVQCLANGSIYPPKSNEAAATVINHFLRKNQSLCGNFVAALLKA